RVAFSPDGRLLALAAPEGEAVWLWDATTGKKVCDVEGGGNPGGYASLVFSPDGGLVAAARRQTIPPAGVPSGRRALPITLPELQAVSAVAFSPDGRTVASAPMYAGPVTLWETATGKARLTLAEPGGWIASIALSPDGRLLAAGGKDGRVHLWDAGTG